MSDSPADPDADVLVVGSGIAGALTAYRLAQAGLRVLVLEGGPELSRDDLRQRFVTERSYAPNALDPLSDYAPTTSGADPNAYLINQGPEEYNVILTKMVGGNTWHWSAACYRFADDDFRMRADYGVGTDWPISYADLEPYYTAAEQELGVTAPSDDAEAGRRSRPTPMADFAWPDFFRRLQTIVEPHGLSVATMGYARNARPYDGRPACRGNNTCWPLCPIGAQYSAIVHIDKARERGARLQDRSLVTRLETAADGTIEAAVFRRPDGSLGRATASAFVLAASGIETPKLLLASASEAFPKGLANSSDQVGRNFMDHLLILTTARAIAPLYPGRGPLSFGHVANVDGGDRARRAAFNCEIDNRMSVDVVAGTVLHEGYFGDDLDAEIRRRATRTFTLISQAEVLPEAGWRLALDWDWRDTAGQPRVRVNAKIDPYTASGLDAAGRLHLALTEMIGVADQPQRARYFGNHPSGATRMGREARSSVVDPDCRAHDHPNLFIAGSAVFPTQGGAKGPTLTIAALALRTAETIITQMRQ